MAGTGYDFSQIYNASLCAFSPGSTFLATAHQDRIVVRSTCNLSIVRTFQCLPGTPEAGPSRSRNETHSIDTLSWSADGRYLLAYGRGEAWVFGLAEIGSGEGGEMAHIGGGVDGLVKVEWARGGREALVWSDYGLRLSIYDLSDGGVRVIQNPKGPECHTWSPDDRYLAVVEKRAGRDNVGIYDSRRRFRLVRHFPLDKDVQAISWSPCGRYLATNDSLLSFSASVYLPVGIRLAEFTPSSPTFAPTESDSGLGIRTMAWAPGGQYLALGGWDGRLRVLENEGWGCIATVQWGSRVADPDVTVWREPSDWIKDTRGHGIVQFDRSSPPASIPCIRPDLSKTNPKMGISQIAFDSQGAFLLVRKDDQPNVAHIHAFVASPGGPPSMRHRASVTFGEPIRHATWTPKAQRVVFATRTGGVYAWDANSAWVDGESDESADHDGGLVEGIGIPTTTDFKAHEVHWAPDGSSLVIQDRTHFCVLYDDPGREVSRVQEDSVVESRWEEGLTAVCEEDELASFSQDWRPLPSLQAGVVA